LDQEITEVEDLIREAQAGNVLGKIVFILPLSFYVFLVSQAMTAIGGAHAGDGDAGRGKVIYQKHCLPCHGSQGRGDGQFGQVTRPPAADFTSPQSKKKTDAQLLDTIRNGRPPTAMEGWKWQLSDGEIEDVLTYVKTLGE
jgi:mono/diheme cytochrome c family protein